MFKTKGFSSNNSLKRRAVIVDAPDLPPEECEFYITSAGIADTDKVDITDSPQLNFPVEKLYEDNIDGISLTDIKGIGKGTAENLRINGIYSLEDLINAKPIDLATKINGTSIKKISEWQNTAKGLLES